MPLRVSSLSIQRFRALRRLDIKGLGRVNLITGRNNTGKSSVLEALRILASNGAVSAISRVLTYREEDRDTSAEGSRVLDSESFSGVSSLFSGFPALGRIGEPIVISASGSGQDHRISLSIERLVEDRSPDGIRRYLPLQDSLFADTDTVPVLAVETNTELRYIPFDRFSRSLIRPNRNSLEDQWAPCVYISPQGTEHTNTLGPLWDNIALSDQENEVVDALRIISPDIIGVSMIGGESSRSARIAIARSKRFDHPVPLRTFGDGLNRLFAIALSLVNAKNGLLVVDEIENGLHHTVQLDIWRAIFRLSRRLDIQVFATSHSWDSVEAFQKAASEDPDDGILIRLSRRGDEVIPTIFREHELAIATRDLIEVR